MSLTVTTQVVFLILKLANIVSWSWLWVLSPLWIAAILFSILLILCIYTDFGNKILAFQLMIGTWFLSKISKLLPIK